MIDMNGTVLFTNDSDDVGLAVAGAIDNQHDFLSNLVQDDL